MIKSKPIPKAALLVLLFPWFLVMSQDCTSYYSQSGFKIIGHTIKRLSGSTTESCISACSFQFNCHSINFDQHQKECELNSANHLSNPESLIQSQGSQYLNYFIRPPANCSDKLCGGTRICLLQNDGQNYQCIDCQDPLGMEDGRIPDSSITAQSQNSSLFAGSKYGRLRSKNWTIEIDGTSLQVDLGKMMAVTKIATQGGTWGSTGFVREYNVEHSTDKMVWIDYTHNGTIVLKGNSDASTVVTNNFEPRLKARYVRISAAAWTGPLYLRVELYGCDLA